jgi:hypothetical protein
MSIIHQKTNKNDIEEDVQILTTIDYQRTEGEEGDVGVGRPMLVDLHISSSLKWVHLEPQTPPVKVVYDIADSAERWLIGGRRRGTFLVRVRLSSFSLSFLCKKFHPAFFRVTSDAFRMILLCMQNSFCYKQKDDETETIKLILVPLRPGYLNLPQVTIKVVSVKDHRAITPATSVPTGTTGVEEKKGYGQDIAIQSSYSNSLHPILIVPSATSSKFIVPLINTCPALNHAS